MEGVKMGHVARMGEIMDQWKCLVGKPEEKRSLEFLGADVKELLKMGLCEIRSECVEWIDLAL
jgi:hypothetical protein